MLPPYIDVFFVPIRDSQLAQAVTVALLVFAALDVLFGTVNAFFFQRDFASHALRQGILRKLANLGLMVVADVLDGLLLSGLDLGWQPLYVTVGGMLVLMEVWSLLEIFAEMHPELSESEVYRMLRHGKENGRDDGV